MKRALLLLAAAGISALGAGAATAPGNPALVQNQIVYVLPMTNGFENYLATELIRQHVVTITTDPKQATVILTDRLGEPLEIKMKELYEYPQDMPKRTERDRDKDKTKDKDDSGSGSKGITTNVLPPRVSTFGRGRGSVYLVDTRSRQVLWSTYQRPKNASASELHHTAEKVTRRLMNDANPAKGQ